MSSGFVLRAWGKDEVSLSLYPITLARLRSQEGSVTFHPRPGITLSNPSRSRWCLYLNCFKRESLGGERVKAPAPHGVWPIEVSVRLTLTTGGLAHRLYVHGTSGTTLSGHVPKSPVHAEGGSSPASPPSIPDLTTHSDDTREVRWEGEVEEVRVDNKIP